MERTGIEPVTSGLQSAPVVQARARLWPEAVSRTSTAQWLCTGVHGSLRER